MGFREFRLRLEDGLREALGARCGFARLCLAAHAWDHIEDGLRVLLLGWYLSQPRFRVQGLGCVGIKLWGGGGGRERSIQPSDFR